jgi:hemoglobin-like flavoprotein
MPLTTQVTETDFELVKASYGNCCIEPTFFEDFYAAFLQSSETIAPMFQNTDMEKQKNVLRTGIATLISFAQGSRAAEMTVDRLAISHNHENLNIDPKLYPFWEDSLIKAVAKNDLTYNTEVDNAWRAVLKIGIDYLISKY